MFSQIPTPKAAAPETWAAIVAALGTIAVAAKKIINRRKAVRDTAVTRTEFHHELTAMRDRIGASYLAVAEKMDVNQKEVLAAIAAQGAAFEQRIDRLETEVARVDERTKF